jgi:hypothetical protein
VINSRQLLEKEFANDGIQVKWTFFKGAGPVINEALANGQVDFAYLGDLAGIIGKSSGLDTRVLAATGRGVKHYLGVQPGSGSRPWPTSRASASASSAAPPASCRSTTPWPAPASARRT